MNLATEFQFPPTYNRLIKEVSEQIILLAFRAKPIMEEVEANILLLEGGEFTIKITLK
jgi:hypothetical protein